MANNDRDFEQRLQTALWGMPLLHPDEQHRCLGTFYERIDLKITFEQALRRDFSNELTYELQRQPERYLLFHGKLDADILSRYVALAQRLQTQFAIRNDRYYRCERNSAAVLLCATSAVEVPTIDICERFPEPLMLKTSQPKQGFFAKLFNR
ncbi:YueI family protein [Lactiplantibacillus modestisalitolerans]|uniref:DUF1694 domain-containing protein n=1 Tax=Lactiplantibacillus modestisalitolerans TaxID=1457219 RepID=A0ABV5WSV1_9LACO|nr:YueI family protein [Lactiplantibacillus modestisalitolerans]